MKNKQAFLSKLSKMILICLLLIFFKQSTVFSQHIHPDTLNLKTGEHDFDFEFGKWRTQLKRLKHPLSGSTEWVEYEGSSIVTKIWDGKANILELNVTGTEGSIQALSLRLYKPSTKQWTLNFSNSRAGTMFLPTYGRFINNRGEFFNQELLNGRAILVKFIISKIDNDTYHFEQSFSDDVGKTWEVNWIATDTRIKE